VTIPPSGYAEYMRSPEWAARRAGVLARAGNCCEFCGAEPGLDVAGGLQVHHTSYENLGAERLGDLIVLCADCHGDAHDSSRRFSQLRSFALRRFAP